jgi:flavin reductase (DIM6/NTAB) family NADH-FMN oxidoreductase RutF
MKKYKVKLEVIETHYLDIDADSIEDAEAQAESYGVNSMDAYNTDVVILNVEDVSKC